MFTYCVDFTTLFYMKNSYLFSKIMLTVLCFSFCIFQVHAQTLLEDVGATDTISGGESIFSETINTISRSGKIFIITNSNQLLSPGDFISLILKDSGPVARAVIAKTYQGQAGLKVLKIYSLKRWGLIRKGISVNILKGDDASLFQPKKKVEKVEDIASQIESEEDLFNEKEIIDSDLSDFYKDTRLIKPDNIITAGYSRLSFTDEGSGDTINNNQFNFTWALQFSDNYWVEALYGRTQIDNYPQQSNQTIINNLTARIKYVIKAPLYSYFIPYIGVQTFSVSSPDAGVALGDSKDDIDQAEAELKTKKDLEKTGIIVGVTVLRRLVPGWFLRVDLGTDITSIGFGIEF